MKTFTNNSRAVPPSPGRTLANSERNRSRTVGFVESIAPCCMCGCLLGPGCDCRRHPQQAKQLECHRANHTAILQNGTGIRYLTKFETWESISLVQRHLLSRRKHPEANHLSSMVRCVHLLKWR